MNYQKRRDELAALLPVNALALLISGSSPYSSGDEKYPFEVDRTFYYLTGLNYEDMMLVILKNDGSSHPILFIPPFDAVQAKWIGGRLLPDQAKAVCGIDDIRFSTDFESFIDSQLTKGGFQNEPRQLWGDLSKQTLKAPNQVSDLFNQWHSRQPDVQIHDLYELIYRLRSVKDADEISCLSKAIEVTNAGLKAMMKDASGCLWENELEARFDYVLKCQQCGHSFPSIVAGGRRATTLHYASNNSRFDKDDLVLCDLGASYKLYCADITRTFPLSGRFTDRQKEIYQIVLQANKMVAQAAGPHQSLYQLNMMVIDFYNEQLKLLGLLTKGKTIRDYYYHSVSHMLGLQCHDVQMRQMPLQCGNIITDEPGLYIEEEGIGIRIEDDLVITETGCKVLSEDIVKEVSDIEDLMRAG